MDVGSATSLKHYEKERIQEAALMVDGIHVVQQVRATQLPINNKLRSVGLDIADKAPVVKSVLMKLATEGLSALPFMRKQVN